MGKKVLHMIGNAHLDPVWLWNWQEGFQENRATFASALDRLKEFDDFVFTSSSAQFYKWIEENDQKMFEEIKKRIKEGRWIICGGFWIQPDCNVPSGESFARHVLLAQNYFYDKFGVISKIGYNVDSFGHNGMLPQILKKSRMDHYVFMRPGPHEKDMAAGTFIWESPDGSQVTAFRIPFSYGVFKDLDKHMERCLNELESGHIMCFYGVGNHGGGPTVDNIKTVREKMQEYKTLGVEVKFSHPMEFFDAIASETDALPVVKEELQYHATGCYSTVAEIKALNRKAENSLVSAEKFSVLGSWLNRSKYPTNLDDAWERVLFNQFHDILPGTSLESAYFDTRNDFGEAISISKRAENNALQAISAAIDIPEIPDSQPLVIYNPHSFDITAPVEFESGFFGTSKLGTAEIEVFDNMNNHVTYQFVESHATCFGRKRVAFMAHVPALGYALYSMRHSETPQNQQAPYDEPLVLENDILRVTFSEKTGQVSGIFHKGLNKEFLSKPTEAAIIQDLTDTWGHSLKKLDQVIGEFKLAAISKLEKGSLHSSMRVVSEYGASKFIQTYTLYDGEDQLKVKASLNWQEQQKALKLYFGVDIKDYDATAEMPYGYTAKACEGREEPAQSWADLSNKDFGMSILNDSKYGIDFNGNTIGLTILRSPVFAHHDPYKLVEGTEYRYMDQGIHDFSYVILPHKGDFKEGGTIKKVALLNQPPIVLPESFHKGTLPQKGGYIAIDADNVMVSALKKAKNSDYYIIRVYELYGQETDATIKIFGKTIKATLRPHEIKSFSFGGNTDPKEVDLLEWDI